MKGLLAISAMIIAVMLNATAFAQQSNKQQRGDECQPSTIKGGVSQFLVTRTASGYTILLPPDLLRQLPYRAKFTIALTDKGNGKGTIVGDGTKNGDNFLNIRTKDRFKLKSVERNTLIGIDISGVGSEAAVGENGGDFCKGCPRSTVLKPYEGDESICWCYSQL
jgi:hypothetical protein